MVNLKIDIDPREDKDKNIYYLGKLHVPMTIDASKGVAFLIFTSEDGSEQLQIAHVDIEQNFYSKFKAFNDKIKVKLEKREDKNNATFYIAKLKFNGTIDLSESSFVIFLSKAGSEELQIVGKIKKTFNKPDVIKKKRRIVKSITTELPA
jgi:hypothetical protein